MQQFFGLECMYVAIRKLVMTTYNHFFLPNVGNEFLSAQVWCFSGS